MLLGQGHYGQPLYTAKFGAVGRALGEAAPAIVGLTKRQRGSHQKLRPVYPDRCLRRCIDKMRLRLEHPELPACTVLNRGLRLPAKILFGSFCAQYVQEPGRIVHRPLPR